MINYEAMLEIAKKRMAFIKEESLENDILNEEWNELSKLHDIFLRLLKTQRLLNGK